MAIPKNWYLKWRKYLTSINWRIWFFKPKSLIKPCKDF